MTKISLNAKNYISFGVITDNAFRAIRDGQVIENLYVTGASLAGANPLYEGSGAGIAYMSAMRVADEIFKD